MREVEFLPPWYPHLRRRRMHFALQVWVTVLGLIALGAVALDSQRQLRAAEVELEDVEEEITQTTSDLQKLDELLMLQRQWRQQDQVISKLGLYVEMTRMFTTLEQIMPPTMSLVLLSCETEEQPLVPAGPPAVGRAAQQQEQDAPVSRRLRVRLQGVAPSDVDLGNFLAKLTSLSFFERVALTYTRDRVAEGHLMREFELTFSLNLDVIKGN